MKQISISEVSPRDGFQSVKEYIPLEVKEELIGRMLDAGLRRIQIGSFVSPRAIPQMRETGDLAKRLLRNYPEARFFALAPNLRGVQAAVESGLREVTYVVSMSESHNRANINRTIDQSLAELREIRTAYPELDVHLDAATAFGCPFEGRTPLKSLLSHLSRAADLGVNAIDLCDTIGVAYPSQIEEYVGAVMAEFPHIPIEVHIHDTRNMGMINTWTAIRCGVAGVQTALGGLGGCPFAPGASGNTATEDLVYMLEREGYATGVDFERLLAAAKYMRGLVPGSYSGHHTEISACYRESPAG